MALLGMGQTATRKSAQHRYLSLLKITAGLAFATTAAVGCSGGGSGDGARLAPPDFSSCQLNPSEGKSAIRSHATKSEIIASEFFSKPFNRYDLEAVLDASTVSTTEYVRSLGVALYKVSATRAASSCPTFFNLLDAPAAQHGG
ncbi:MAG: hypothetical protein RBT63_06725, partial [Bdellovibrionales bacterium]|nr:hypothetical protein [Bdellovibrionales bacterium]